MTAIFKYDLPITDAPVICAPIVRVLSVGVQHGKPMLWAEVDPNGVSHVVELFVRGTGHPMTGEEGKFIGTIQLEGGALIFHIFEKNE